MHCSLRIIVQTLVFSRSYLKPRGVSTRYPSSKGRNYLGEKWPVISTESCKFHAYTFGFFYMPQICDMEQTALLPFRREGWGFFFALKNPTVSAGFEPANLGTKGQHATSRPTKPPSSSLNSSISLSVGLPYHLHLVFDEQSEQNIRSSRTCRSAG